MFLWRMQSGRVQQSAQVYQFGTIQMQRCHGSSSSGRQANQNFVCLVPGEMVTPAIVSWVIQGRWFLGDGIQGICFVVFVIIATLTGQTKIL